MDQLLSPQIFSVPIDEERFLIYAPLRKTAFIGNSALAAQIASVCSGDISRSDADASSELMHTLLSDSFFDDAVLPPDPYLTEGVRYDTVILFLTNCCNLRCGYCYARSGEYAAKKMTWEIAKSAIDVAMRDAVKNGVKDFTLGFHGGGEPSMHFDMLSACAAYAEEIALNNSMRLMLSGAFNGCWNEPMRNFFNGRRAEISISLDGLPDIQNVQRPFADGRGSFDAVDATLLALEKAGTPYGLRMTVTESSVRRLAESIDFISRRYKPVKIQAEPVFEQGRAADNDCAVRDLSVFVQQFVRAHKTAQKRGIELFYSGARPDLLTSRFCLAPCRALVVTPDGDVTACFESYGREHPLSSRFIIGGADGNGSFSVDREKLDACFNHTVYENEHCASCFCRWHCAGDCAIKTMRQDGDKGYVSTERCAVNRELTLYLILQKIAHSGGVIWRG